MNNYDSPNKIIKITQVIVIILAAINAAVVMAIQIISGIRIGQTSGIDNLITVGIGVLYAVGILMCGAVIWALLYGVRAVFEIAVNTRNRDSG